jgi:NADPH:quinone reductase-like Zn-dependent oxidoreductase
MKAVVFERFGDPAEVLRVRDLPLPEPGRGQVRVRMRASPVNPSDLLVVRGTYGRLPTLPATPGFEGVGVIDAAGFGLVRMLRGLKPGRRVAVLNGAGGNWQEYVVLPARAVVPLADDVNDDQAATFFVNPATAVVMTRLVLRVPRGEWLLQTAANSTLGRMIVRLAKHDGYKTINVVRKKEAARDMLKLGGDAAISTQDESVTDRVRELTGGAGVRYAIDAVGGATGLAAAHALAPGGRLLLYGSLSGEPIPLEPRTLMVGQKTVQGFWLSEWVRQQRALTMLKLFRRIRELLKAGVLTSEVAASFTLDEIQAAVRTAQAHHRPGKILLRMAVS